MPKNSTTNKLVKLFGREYSVQYTEQSIMSLQADARHLLPAIVDSQVYVPEHGVEFCSADPVEWQKFLDSLHNAYGTPIAAKKFVRLFHAYGKRYVIVAKQVAKGAKTDDNGSLIKRYKQYQKALTEYNAFLWMGYLLNNWYSDRAKEILKSKNVADSSHLEAILSPAKRTSILALSDTLAAIKKTGKRMPDVLAKRLLKKYAWMSCLDIHNDVWIIGELQSLYNGVKVGDKKLSYSTALRELKLTEQEQKFFDTVRTMVYVKDMRDEYRRKAIFAVRPFFEAMARALNVSRAELAYFTEEEIIDALDDKQKAPKKNEIERRRAGFVIYRKAGKTTVLSELNLITKYIADNFGQAAPQTELRGTAASRGMVKGRVAIVRGIKDLEKVKTGDIMVAVTTHPDFVPAMHRAAAFVTDEGGLTSHAAIVAREMQKPCVVGVQNASSELKDGDIVEVDAMKGVVRKV